MAQGNKTGSTDSTEVELPAGGVLHLQTLEEVEMWERVDEKYRDDYALTRTNDLVLLGAILTQTLTLFRAQQRLNGMEAELDANGVPTGRYKKVSTKISEQAKAQGMILKASEEIRNLEKALGIDKKTRDAGGGDSVADYLSSLKVAGRQLGVHVSRRVKAYEEFAMELRWKLRVLHGADDEDRARHDISEKTICDWATSRLSELEEIDKKFASEKQRIFAGKL